MTTTDHTPAEAGTDRAWCFRLGEAMVDVGWEGGEPYVIAMDGRTELINADDHNQASLLEAFRVLHEFLARVTPLRADVAFPSVVPGDTSTEGGDEDLVAANEALGEALTEIGMALGLPKPRPGATWGAAEVLEVARADRAAREEISRLLATAGTEGETGHDWGGFVSYRAWADGVRWGAEHGRGEWDDAERAWADWTGTIAETVAAEDGPVAASPQGEPQGQGEGADSDANPWVEDVDIVWHHRPAGQPWVMDREDGANAETSCGKWVPSVHVSTHVPDTDAGSVLCRECVESLALAAPRVVAPVGNVDREALDELMWQAFKDAQVIHDGADDHDDRFRAPTMFERRRMADVALAALRGERR